MTAARIRLNPRQRWAGDGSNGDNSCLALAPASSVIAGVSGAEWGAMIAAANHYNASDAKKSSDANPDIVGTESYNKEMAEFIAQLTVGIKRLDRVEHGQWVEQGQFRLIVGRPNGADFEVTVVTADNTAMRAFLTQAYLGLTIDQHPDYNHDALTSWQKHLIKVLDLLDKSKNRNPYNGFTYRDYPLSAIGPAGIARRKENIQQKIRFRATMANLFASLRAKRAEAASE